MIFSMAAILGATMGTASGVLTLCGLSLFGRSCRRSKLEDGDECDPEKPAAGVLTSLQQVSCFTRYSMNIVAKDDPLSNKSV